MGCGVMDGYVVRGRVRELAISGRTFAAPINTGGMRPGRTLSHAVPSSPAVE